MNTLQKNKEPKHLFLDKTFLIFRPSDFPMLIKPVRVRVSTTCEITGKDIESGEFAYPCLTNPVRLTPYGNYRVKVSEALKRGNQILPQGYFAMPIPTTESLKIKGLLVDRKRDKYLSNEVVKQLKG